MFPGVCRSQRVSAIAVAEFDALLNRCAGEISRSAYVDIVRVADYQQSVDMAIVEELAVGR